MTNEIDKQLDNKEKVLRKKMKKKVRDTKLLDTLLLEFIKKENNWNLKIVEIIIPSVNL